jgi:hypothetical protein
VSGSSGAVVDPASGHCYVAWDSPVTWIAAQADCRSRGGHLATITSQAEETLVEQVRGGVDRWIGLERNTLQSGSPMVWVSGEATTFLSFAPGQPADVTHKCGNISSDGWHDALCNFPTNGGLPATTGSPKAYVCEHTCGNGVVEPGEQCDPPGASCTSTCQRKALCTEVGGNLSDATGNCFFPNGGAVTYSALSCPLGTHVAAMNEPDEVAAAQRAAGANDSWVGLRAATTVNVFAWDVPGFALEPDRFHAFSGGDPNLNVVPACTIVNASGWKDRACTDSYIPICERERP